MKDIEDGRTEKGGHGDKLDPAATEAGESSNCGADERYQTEDL